MTTMDGDDLRFDFAALPERVWEAMANPSKAAGWLPDGLVAQIGRRFTFPGPHRISGEVIAVDPPSRVALRWRRPGELGAPAVESVMTWVVARAPGGASVRVVLSSIDDPAVADLVVAVRILLNERLRAVLRPAHGPAPASSASPVFVEIATPDESAAPGVRAGVGEQVIEGGSQAVSVWPVLRKAKARPSESEPRRRTGSALAYRLVGVIAIAAAIGAVTLGAAAIPWGNAPGESTLSDDAAATDSPATLDTAAQVNLGGQSPGSAATAAPGSGGTATSGPTSTPLVPPVIPPLTVSLEVVDQTLGYTVIVTITNPAGSPQAWQNVTVHIDGLNLLITVVGSVVKLLVPGNDPCFAPAMATSIGAGQTLQFSFKVTAVADLADPTLVRLNQGAC
jgi:uncharacterized protein YndB with AHSA1/START domain